MSAQALDGVLRCYRIGDPDGDYPIFDATGSTLIPGRWNNPESAIIYASEYYSTAMLEKFVRGSRKIPPNQHFIEITLPNGLSYETVTLHSLSGWERKDCAVSRVFGDAWLK